MSTLRQRPAKGVTKAITPTSDEADKNASSKPVESNVDVWSAWDWAIIVTLAVVAAVTRFWRIENPKDVIFDEVCRTCSASSVRLLH